MAEHSLFSAKLVTPEGTAFDGQVRELEVTSVSGGLGILARRAPIVADLRMGQVRAQLEDGSWSTWATAEGFAQASQSVATVVVEDAVPVGEIDAAEAGQIASEARARLEHVEREGGDSADLESARREIAWGEHLAAMHARYA